MPDVHQLAHQPNNCMAPMPATPIPQRTKSNGRELPQFLVTKPRSAK